MKIEKLSITEEKKNINIDFYFFLKYTIKLKPTSNQINKLIEYLNLCKNNAELIQDNFVKIFENSKLKIDYIKEILIRLDTKLNIELFNYSLELIQIKDLLLEEAKIFEAIELKKLSNIDPLSLEYDKISVLKPYKTRVCGALLALSFFEKIENEEYNFMSDNSIEFIKNLGIKALRLKKLGLESNQIFMLVFNESINQSIISDSGSDYEDRIKIVLNKIGIKEIKKIHDINDKSTEYDLFFKINKKSFGISAKRTLRERYKQFIKTSFTSGVDVSIQITIGIDLNEQKAKNIIKDGTYIFVAEEVYKSKIYLQKLNKVFSLKDLNIKTLKKL